MHGKQHCNKRQLTPKSTLSLRVKDFRCRSRAPRTRISSRPSRFHISDLGGTGGQQKFASKPIWSRSTKAFFKPELLSDIVVQSVEDEADTLGKLVPAKEGSWQMRRSRARGSMPADTEVSVHGDRVAVCRFAASHTKGLPRT